MRDQPQLAEEQMKLAEMDMRFMEAGSAVSADMMGQKSNVTSGRALEKRQTQGAVVTAPMFDNLRLGVQLTGEIELSNIEQFMSEPRMIRVLGPRGKPDFLEINKPVEAENGETRFFNDITAFQADFVVSEQDFSETIRLALFEQLMEMLGKMPEEFAAQLLDAVLELAPVPGIEELVRRIRKLTGQTDPDAEPTQEDLDAAAAKQKEQAEKAAIEKDGAIAEVDLKRAQAEKYRADAKKIMAEAGVAGLDDAAKAELDSQVRDMQERYDTATRSFTEEVQKIRLAASQKEMEIESRYNAAVKAAEITAGSNEKIAKYQADRDHEASKVKTAAEKEVGLAQTKHEDAVRGLETALADITKQLKAQEKALAKATKEPVAA
jgi:hypothetical protein